MWQKYWENWKDIYVNLSWVHRYKNLCSTESIEWFNSYCKTHPHILPLINYCKDIRLQKEEIIDNESFQIQNCKESDIINELYEEFFIKCYWVHFIVFLQYLKLEVNEELKSFLASHEIYENPPEVLIDFIEKDDTELVMNFENSDKSNDHTEISLFNSKDSDSLLNLVSNEETNYEGKSTLKEVNIKTNEEILSDEINCSSHYSNDQNMTLEEIGQTNGNNFLPVEKSFEITEECEKKNDFSSNGNQENSLNNTSILVNKNTQKTR